MVVSYASGYDPRDPVERRRAAIHSLKNSIDPEVVALLVGVLAQDPDAGVRVETAKALHRHIKQTTVQAVLRGCAQGDGSFSDSTFDPARSMCNKVFYDQGAEVGRLQDAADGLGSEPLEARRGAIWALFLSARQDSVMGRLLPLTMDSEAKIRLEVVKTLFKAVNRPEVWPGILKLARTDEDAEVRKAAIWSLTNAKNQPAVRTALQAMRDKGGDDATNAIIALDSDHEESFYQYFHNPGGGFSFDPLEVGGDADSEVGQG